MLKIQNILLVFFKFSCFTVRGLLAILFLPRSAGLSLLSANGIMNSEISEKTQSRQVVQKGMLYMVRAQQTKNTILFNDGFDDHKKLMLAAVIFPVHVL